MSDFRFKVGAAVMCNLGPSGWKLGRVIALRYREPHWPARKEAPYQVMLEGDHALIYVPVDDVRYCREATAEDLRIARRMDALAVLPPELEGAGERHEGQSQLGCGKGAARPCSPDYRSGRCHCCHGCPRSWSAVELYSEHYRCAARNGLKVTQRSVDLGAFRVGEPVELAAGSDLPVESGFMQCPTLVRLPPGVRFYDDGGLSGEVRFDPHRGSTYRVEFVAVSTASWNDAAVGIVRLEVAFVVVGNDPPDEFDVDAFEREQEQARAAARRSLENLGDAWGWWEEQRLNNLETCEMMRAELGTLRELLEAHPRLDGGRWWAMLGGFHMNVHKLLENALFECELYLGHALTFGDAEVRRMAEQNLDGCYKKRLLEAARFMWMDGAEQMMRGQWAAAAQTLREAAGKMDGWGWAVNYGDIWLGESAARLVHGAQLELGWGAGDGQGARWIEEGARLLDLGLERANRDDDFGQDGHPWAAELVAAFESYRGLKERGADVTDWLEAFKARTVFWCAQILGGVPPFPPKPRPRLEDADALKKRLPGHNA